MHWKGVWIVVGMDKSGVGLVAGPVSTAEEARKLAADKVRFDPAWKRAFCLEAPFGYDFHMSSAIPDELEPDKVRRAQFPDLPPMELGANDRAFIQAARGGRPAPHTDTPEIEADPPPSRRGRRTQR